ncbi:MAG TPA: substrate-binding domain-containing protein [Pseudomonadales bacterium]|nr:substrate-binding domain-containing protein [Pseudomonadales bacterium]
MRFPRPALVLACACLWLAACGPSEPSGGTTAKYEIAVVPKGTTHEFWKSIHAGAVKAERELVARGIVTQVVWQGPLKEDDRDAQIQVVENFVTRRVSGIVLAPLDARALVRPVDSAIAAGIPVVIIDSGLERQTASFVATDNYEGGAMAARHLAELLGGTGKVILLRYAVGSASTEQREKGFLDELAKNYSGLELISGTEYAGATRDTAYRTSQALLNRYGDQVNGIFAVNESATIGMTLALRESGKAGGKVRMIGFDAGTQSIEDLANGDVQALVVQNPLRMGYEGVMTAVSAIRGETVAPRIDTGVVLVTAQNMNSEAVRPLLHPPLAEYLD